MRIVEDVYLVDYLRTAFSRSRPKEPQRDVYNSIRMDEAEAMLIKELVNKNKINPFEINDVITGCAAQAGENWLYGGRHPVFLAELPFEVPSMAIDRACSSSMNAIAIGFWEIMSGYSDIVLAGGMEHMTHVRRGYTPHIEANEKLLKDPKYKKYNMDISYNMGLTAEKLAEITGIKRDEMDEFSLRSHRLATEALNYNYFKGEILPIEVEYEGKKVIVDKDLSVRPDTNLEQLSKLPPAFKPDGIITAGNSSPMNAGASMTMLMNEKTMEKYNLKPLAKIVAFGWAAVDPSIMGEGPVPASKKALRYAGLNIEDIDYWEINEAFAVVVLNAVKNLNIDLDKVNIHGGAIAIGHPLGASGARITGTLARILKEKNAKYGLATLCVGGGQGFSVILENVNK
jgi:acetyl-CoA C-acetyltransferase